MRAMGRCGSLGKQLRQVLTAEGNQQEVASLQTHEGKNFRPHLTASAGTTRCWRVSKSHQQQDNKFHWALAGKMGQGEESQQRCIRLTEVKNIFYRYKFCYCLTDYKLGYLTRAMLPCRSLQDAGMLCAALSCFTSSLGSTSIPGAAPSLQHSQGCLSQASVPPKPGFFQRIKELLNKKISSEQACCVIQKIDFTTGKDTWGVLPRTEPDLAMQAGGMSCQEGEAELQTENSAKAPPQVLPSS